jgi:hypothetical protein
MKKKCLKDRTNSSKLLSHKKCYFGLKKRTSISLFRPDICGGPCELLHSVGPAAMTTLDRKLCPKFKGLVPIVFKINESDSIFVSKMFLDKEKNGCCSVFF